MADRLTDAIHAALRASLYDNRSQRQAEVAAAAVRALLDEAAAAVVPHPHANPWVTVDRALAAQRAYLADPATETVERNPMPPQPITDIDHRFDYHPPRDDATRDRHEAVREVLKVAATALNMTVPDGREKSLAITALEEAMMWANAAIARNSP